MSSLVPKPRGTIIGINTILQICNFLVASLICLGLLRNEFFNHPYVDILTLVLGLCLCVQNHIVLRLERCNPDPFVLILVYVLIFFYSLRIYTLLLYPEQEVFERFDFGASDFNFALIYILLINTSLYIGLHQVKLSGFGEIECGAYKARRPVFGVLLFFVSILYAAIGQSYLPEIFATYVNLIYQNFLTPNVILIALAAYIVTFRRQLPPIYIKIAFGGAVIVAIMQTLAFSRSGIINLFEYVLLVVLALVPNIKIRCRSFLISLAALAILFSIMFNLYAISTTSRMLKGDSGQSLGEKIGLMMESSEALRESDGNDRFIGKAFARAGFIDFTSEIIANKQRYSDVFTFKNYIKSVVDNVLTPGFDVFDQPKISNSLKYTLGNIGHPSKANEVGSQYHTDQFGLYGEMFNLFGWLSLFVVGLIGYFVKHLFKCGENFNPRVVAINRILILWVFFQWINSFGLDWILFNIMVTSLSLYGISKLLVIRIGTNLPKKIR